MISFNFSDNPDDSLNDNVYPCDFKVPENGTFQGYEDLKNCTCTYCDLACSPTTISSAIGFFDGFDTGIVTLVYIYLILFTIVF